MRFFNSFRARGKGCHAYCIYNSGGLWCLLPWSLGERGDHSMSVISEVVVLVWSIGVFEGCLLTMMGLWLLVLQDG